jgi:hypothetical protein
MNWDAIGAIGQALSALALVVVIVQVRLSTAETLRSIRQNRTNDEQQTISDQAQSEWLCHVLAKGMDAYGVQLPFIAELMDKGLTHPEAWAFVHWAQSWWLSDQQNITHVDMLSKAERAAFDSRLRAMYQANSPRLRFLEMTRPILNQEAVRYVDTLLAQPG